MLAVDAAIARARPLRDNGEAGTAMTGPNRAEPGQPHRTNPDRQGLRHLIRHLPARAPLQPGAPMPILTVMIALTPILLAIVYGLVAYRFSVWRTRADLDARSAPLADAGLRKIAERLAAALEVPGVRVHVYDIPQVNGLAAPDGRIFITTGFLNRYRAGSVTAEELASVIAHELGHVALGHTRRRMIDFSGQNAMRTALALVLNRVLPGVGPMIANGLVMLVAQRISRADEYAADAYASALLIKAGIGTAPQKSLFTKLDTLTGGRGGAMPAWMLSHPKSADRIAAIEGNEARWLSA